MTNSFKQILRYLLICSLLIFSNSFLGTYAYAKKQLELETIESKSINKTLYIGEIELLKFNNYISEIFYLEGNSSNIINIEQQAADANGFKMFKIKALNIGSTVVNFSSKNQIISLNINVIPNYQVLEDELNKHFGIHEQEQQNSIKVIPRVETINSSEQQTNSIFLKGYVNNAKDAVLALSYASKALGDKGIKIYANPGGSLKEEQNHQQNFNNNQQESFISYYENSNHLSEIQSIYRDLILSSESEKVISFLKIKEAKRFKVQVRFLELSQRYLDQFLNSLILTTKSNDIKGGLGSPVLSPPNTSISSNFISNKKSSLFSTEGLVKLGLEVMGGNLASGSIRLIDDTVLNILINNLIENGVLNLKNEFTLTTHSGETVSLGKGTRFPIPKINSNVGGNTIGIEYIPIGFHGELKVSELKNNLIDVQLASRLTTAETSNSSIEGFQIPVINEQFTNNGAILNNNQEIILSSFLTESNEFTEAKSPLARIIPFLGKSHQKSKSKNILFISVKASLEDFDKETNLDDFNPKDYKISLKEKNK